MKNTNVLIIDDDTLFCDSVMMTRPKGMTFYAAHTAKDGLEQCRARTMDVVVLDQNLPDGNGADLCPDILLLNEQCKIIFASAYPKLETAIQAVKIGAYDYLTKPFALDELLLVINRAIRCAVLEQVEEVSSWENRQKSQQAVFLGKSRAAEKVRQAVSFAATSRASVLLTGDTGTGKSHLAHCIHFQSQAPSSPFISINCGALPENLIESELFGHERGAFTGASKMRKGVFEMADSGTLFLDEIGTLPIHLQAKLLGVLDDGKISRIGSERDRRVNVRIIAATNLDLEQAVSTGAFREDLYYRLSVLHIHMPTLAERLVDIEELSNFFLAGRGHLDNGEIQQLMQYSWPGNVRELRNIIDRSLILHQPGPYRPALLIDTDKLPANRRKEQVEPTSEEQNFQVTAGKLPSLAETEKSYIYHVLDAVENNHSEAARVLDISRSTLLRKLKRYAAQ
ncbi:MAG: sigma-54 dependent transcriptional regulator [Thermodesulfobacteriota bacterium]